MKRVLAAVVLAFVVTTSGRACLNGETKVLAGDILLYADHETTVPYGHSFLVDASWMEICIRRLDSLYKVSHNLDYRSDQGLLLILLERYDEAISLYQDIERSAPDRYATASNIGTAYELMGNNREALR